MQAMTTMNVAGLGLGVRARTSTRVRSSISAKVVLSGTPVVGKSAKGFAPRRSAGLFVEARNIRRQMMSNDNESPAPAVYEPTPIVSIPAGGGIALKEIIPIAEGPFVGIMKDIKARGPLYINDYMQGVSFKSVVSLFLFLFFPSGKKFRTPKRTLACTLVFDGFPHPDGPPSRHDVCARKVASHL
jgi:hypothetical protein